MMLPAPRRKKRFGLGVVGVVMISVGIMRNLDLLQQTTTTSSSLLLLPTPIVYDPSMISQIDNYTQRRNNSENSTTTTTTTTTILPSLQKQEKIILSPTATTTTTTTKQIEWDVHPKIEESSRRNPIIRTTQEQQQQKQPIIIGEDCNWKNTSCEYFNPVQFVSTLHLSYPPISANVYSCYDKMIRIDQRTCYDTAKQRQLNKKNYQPPTPTTPTVQSNMNSTTAPAAAAAAARRRQRRCQTQNSKTHIKIDVPWNFAYKHMFKSGGSTITMNGLPRMHSKLIGFPHSTGTDQQDAKHLMKWAAWVQQQKQQESFNSTTSRTFRGGGEGEGEGGGNQFPLIAVLRDPVSRFASAISQVLNMKGRLNRCSSSQTTASTWGMTPQQRAECAFRILQQDRISDPHLSSQLQHLLCASQGQSNVVWSLYDISSVSNLVTGFGGIGTRSSNNSTKKRLIVKPQDFGDKLLQEICTWFQADIAMMKYLGFPLTYCTTTVVDDV